MALSLGAAGVVLVVLLGCPVRREGRGWRVGGDGASFWVVRCAPVGQQWYLRCRGCVPRSRIPPGSVGWAGVWGWVRISVVELWRRCVWRKVRHCGRR